MHTAACLHVNHILRWQASPSSGFMRVHTCDHAGELVAQPSILVPHLHHHILAWHALPMHALCLPRLEVIHHTLQSLHPPCTVRPSPHTSDSAAETRGKLCCRLTMQCAYSGVSAMHFAAGNLACLLHFQHGRRERDWSRCQVSARVDELGQALQERIRHEHLWMGEPLQGSPRPSAAP